MYQIRIELRSGLCAASGEGFATTIDTDIATDRYGLPYLPARRLKGCLREAAVYLYGKDHQVVRAIFGVPGDLTTGALHLENGQIQEYQTLQALCTAKAIPPAKVTACLTDTMAATAVTAGGTTKENSLRFMRYVPQHKIWDPQENLVFCSNVKIDPAYVTDLGRICKALRHLGYKTTRGFGNIRCTLVSVADSDPGRLPALPPDPAGMCQITYAVRLEEGLMLPQEGTCVHFKNMIQ